MKLRVIRSLFGSSPQGEINYEFLACNKALPDPPFHEHGRVVFLMCAQKCWAPAPAPNDPLSGFWFRAEKADEITALIEQELLASANEAARQNRLSLTVSLDKWLYGQSQVTVPVTLGHFRATRMNGSSTITLTGFLSPNGNRGHDLNLTVSTTARGATISTIWNELKIGKPQTQSWVQSFARSQTVTLSRRAKER